MDTKDKLNILGLSIRNATYQELIKVITEHINNNRLYLIHNVNAYIFCLAQKDKELKTAMENFSDLYSDGIGVYLASKLLYGKFGLKERLNGTDLYYKILKLAEQNEWKCFFYGGGKEASNKLKEKILKDFPNLKISGILSRDTFFNEKNIEKIRTSHSDILFVGLGSPLQEIWAYKYSKYVNIPFQITIGSGIEFLSGEKKRAPEFLRKLGMEWTFRIYLEPKRLLFRYLYVIPKFFLLILRDIVYKRY